MQEMSLMQNGIMEWVFSSDLDILSCCQVQLTIIFGLNMSVNILMSKGGLLYAK